MKKVLIIEDELDLLEGVSEILGFEGYDVHTAPNGVEGIDAAISLLPDIVLSDIMMPGVDGFEVVRRLREEPQTASIPIILITALSERVNIRKGMELGANDYMIKPFTRSELLDAINAQLNYTPAPKAEERNSEDDQKLEFSLSYEFRTPLNVIMGFSSLLAAEARSFPIETIEQMGRSISEESNTLFEVIKKYLILIDIEINKSTGVRTNISGFDEMLLSIVQETAHKHNRSDDLYTNLIHCDVEAEPKWIELVIKELIHNAFKFSKKGNRVKVHLTLNNDFLELVISDEGIGQSIENIDAVNEFESFSEGIAVAQDLFGILLCKRIIMLHQGEFQLENNADDGLTIRLTLPLK